MSERQMGKQINIGQLDRKVLIIEYTKVKSSTGDMIETEVLYKNAWVKADDKTSNEEEEGKIWLYAMRNYTMRYDAGIVAKGELMIVRDSDGDFNIAGIQQIGRKKYMVLKTMKRE